MNSVPNLLQTSFSPRLSPRQIRLQLSRGNYLIFWDGNCPVSPKLKRLRKSIQFKQYILGLFFAFDQARLRSNERQRKKQMFVGYIVL